MDVDTYPAREPRPAGFWVRVVALALDFLLFFLVQFSLGYIAGRLWGREIEDSWTFQLLVVAFTFLFTAAYTTVLHAFGGQTVGKMVVGVRVVAADGRPLSLGAALLRYFAYFVSVATLALGYLMAGLRRDKRALHDLLAGSRVERMPRRKPEPILVEPTDMPVPPVG
jgi:uncharacterized RDD family membrane protein YckC